MALNLQKAGNISLTGQSSILKEKMVIGNLML